VGIGRLDAVLEPDSRPIARQWAVGPMQPQADCKICNLQQRSRHSTLKDHLTDADGLGDMKMCLRS
jgi:hypothetical protein